MRSHWTNKAIASLPVPSNAPKKLDYQKLYHGTTKPASQAISKDGWKTESIVEDLNEMFKYKPKTFIFGEFALMNKMSYLDPHGDSVDQSPIWIRPKSLMRANKDTLRKKIIQVVGHTQQTQIDKKGGATGGRYYFIDTLGTSGEYMIIEEGLKEIKFATIK
jgi:hypothetical protein